MRAKEFINEAVLDPTGWGQTPNGTDIDYFGLRVQMRPSTFLKLALPLGQAETNPEVEKYMKSGGKIAYPMIDVKIPPEWEDGQFKNPAMVVSHEGRNRMTQWVKLHGDEPIQINILPRGGMRRRHITDKMIHELSKGMISQRGNFVSGPLFPVDSALEEDTIYEAFDVDKAFPIEKWYEDEDSYANIAVAYDNEGRTIEIIFTPLHEEINAIDFDFTRNGTYEKTGEGDAMKVFATVLKAFNEYLKNINTPDYILFASKGGSRTSAYQALLKRFAGRYGYREIPYNTLPDEISSQPQAEGHQFVLARFPTDSALEEDIISEMALQDFEIHNTPKLDRILAKCCELVLGKQAQDSEHWGMVGACVLDHEDRAVYGVNYATPAGTRVHAERAALDNYRHKYGEPESGCIIITTLSPCSQTLDERYGESCQDLINNSNIHKVYAGYQDHTQSDSGKKFHTQITRNTKLNLLCQRFANTFLDDIK